MTEYIDFRKGDCQELIKTLPDASVNIILTDPPYLYLKGQKLEREFDEEALFKQWHRVLKPGGFIVMFGRGTSFYRWNYLLSTLGFEFKEEIVWDKMQISNPMNAVCRQHENISIHGKGKSPLNFVKVPFIEANKYDEKKIRETINRIKTTFGNRKTFELLEDYYNNGVKVFNEGNDRQFDTTVQKNIQKLNRTVQFAVSLEEGQSERSIIRETREHYSAIHPTQKPVSILKRLLALVIKSKDDVVLDCFAGSGSTGEACLEMKLKCILFEYDDEYYNGAKERLEKAYRNMDRQIPMFE